MDQSTDMPSHEYGPWWPRALVLLFVTAGFVILGALGVDIGIVFALLGVAGTVMVTVLVIRRARHHHESLHEAAVWLMFGEYGRSRLEGRRNEGGPRNP